MKLLPEPEPLLSPDDVDLSSHAFIEASAGTGKTYTIENLVLNLLKEERVDRIEQILIVTYTEKAVSDLKNRIRSKVDQCSESTGLIRDAQEHFESLSIYTIHGFCHRVLKEFPFETSMPRETELVPGPDLYESVMHRVLQGWIGNNQDPQWQDVYAISGLYDSIKHKGSGKEKNLLVKKVLDAVNAAARDHAPVFYPSPAEDVLAVVKEFQQQIKSIIQDIRELTPADLHSWLHAQFEPIVRKGSFDKLDRILLRPLADFSLHCEENVPSLYQLIRITMAVKENYKKGVENIINKKHKPLDEQTPQVFAFLQFLDGLLSIDTVSIAGSIVSLLALDVIKEADNELLNQSLITYDFMLKQVLVSLHREDGLLVNRLQKQYAYAIVDEFQDTDPVQWEIFKRVFLGDENRLVLIGDPKQAIYSFRGADLDTYLEARDAMVTRPDCRFYTLSVNWRSLPGLVGACNTMFRENWFSSNLTYRDALSPADDPSFMKRIEPFQHEEEPVTLVSCSSSNVTDIKTEWSQAVASEIVKLVAENRFRLKDIAVLIQTRDWIPSMIKACSQRQIPVAVYNRRGLFQSLEYREVITLLRAIEEPADPVRVKPALLTRFFGIKPGELDSAMVAYEYLLSQWYEHAEKSDWPELFVRILSQAAACDNGDHLELYRHLFNLMEMQAFGKQGSLREIIEWVEAQATREVMDQDGIPDIGEEEKVRIITIHSSKGLEFPVVFVAGGFSAARIPDVPVYRNSGARVYDVSNTLHSQEVGLEHAQEELQRLYYVAYTRAIAKVYIPFTENSSTGYINNRIIEHIVSNNNQFPVTLAGEMIDTTTCELSDPGLTHKTGRTVFHDVSRSFNQRDITLTSFSGIISTRHHGVEEELEERILDEQGEHEMGDPGGDGLPGGTETGSMVHDLLEYCIVHRIKNIEDNQDVRLHAARLVDKYFVSPGRDKNFIVKEALRMVQQALTRVYPGMDVSLMDMEEMVPEMEFYLKHKGVVLRGFMDLVFRYNGKFYILDWKTNTLSQGYSPEQCSLSMEESGYDIQYTIYIQALVSWLKKIDDKFDFNNHFGGVYYIYLRGLADDIPEQGIFFTRPGSEKDVLKSFNGMIGNY